MTLREKLEACISDNDIEFGIAVEQGAGKWWGTLLVTTCCERFASRRHIRREHDALIAVAEHCTLLCARGLRFPRVNLKRALTPPRQRIVDLGVRVGLELGGGLG